MPKEITRASLAEAILSKTPPILVEALPRRNYESGHIPGARPLPLDELARLAPGLAPDKDAAIVVYCSNLACPNSHQAAEFLTARGYRNVTVYSAGKQDWTEAGLKLEV
jgi:rhodanese-related sulfurtransferase